MGVEVRRAGDRFVTRTEWLCSRHSFSFGEHYEPGNVGHGPLRVHNDDVIAPGAGYDTHRHLDAEILTWVVAGRLAHQDSTGHVGLLTAGTVQRTSAGTGITHSERNASATEPLRFVQMHLAPDEPDAAPSYEQASVQIPPGTLVTAASGRSDRPGVVRIGNRYAALHVARLAEGDVVTLPGAAYLHVYVVSGAVDLEAAGSLVEGDGARATDAGPLRLTGTTAWTELLIWEMSRPS